MPTYAIHIEGQVQSVGYRPLAYRLAHALKLTGHVANGMDGVHIVVHGEADLCALYYQSLIENPPALALVTRNTMTQIRDHHFNEFRIIESEASSKPSLLLTPDLALCDDCRRELHDRTNRRYHYPFTTCLACGPRYSIVRELPYDRHHTTMQPFEMCKSCAREYRNPLDRRYYSQTNSCTDCGVQLSFLTPNGECLAHHPEDVLHLMADAIDDGLIVAVKGIGGFLLLADATQRKTIERLRQRKHRPTKPFAVMYPGIQSVLDDALASETEIAALQGVAAPIVLLKTKPVPASGIVSHVVAPGMDTLGVMLPYAPLFEMLLRRCGRPLVATSANVSQSPILYTNEQAMERLGGIADFIVTNNRDIVMPQDDSVLRFTEHNQPVFLRRSRGYAPTLLPNPLANTEHTVLGLGAELKSTFALLHNDNVYVSQYLGDLQSMDTQQSFEHTLHHLQSVLHAKPSTILIDSHPEYYSSQLGRELALVNNAEVMEVQHHEAHFAAVLAENNLLNSREPVLGVIWDGTGWGDDRAIWGGEYFVFEDHAFTRVKHLDYFKHLPGNKLQREPRLSALAMCHGLPIAQELLQSRFTVPEWQYFNKALHSEACIPSSSIGRLFDAVASLLGLCDHATYEGEAALYLEAAARKGRTTLPSWGPLSKPEEYMARVVQGLQNRIPVERIAFQFHRSLVDWIEHVARTHGLKKIAFSGGVFQNALLVDLIHEQLGSFELFFHNNLSPNDECISVGQLACHQLSLRKATVRKETIHVNS